MDLNEKSHQDETSRNKNFCYFECRVIPEKWDIFLRTFPSNVFSELCKHLLYPAPYKTQNNLVGHVSGLELVKNLHFCSCLSEGSPVGMIWLCLCWNETGKRSQQATYLQRRSKKEKNRGTCEGTQHWWGWGRNSKCTLSPMDPFYKLCKCNYFR